VVGALLGDYLPGRPPSASDPSTSGVRVSAGEVPHIVRFILAAPRASRVSLVGEFNGWDAAATPMLSAGENGMWTVTVPLAPGRHMYAFIVDGERWMTDPDAPLAPEDGFGVRNSVVVVSNRPGAT
jgi:1,4-alpha-glucan branching enzyme